MSFQVRYTSSVINDLVMENVGSDFIFHAKTVEETVLFLDSDIEKGLTIDKAKERLNQFGLNAIAEAEVISAVKILFNQLP